jgi:tetratricopeptide (TPR) repeat protein
MNIAVIVAVGVLSAVALAAGGQAGTGTLADAHRLFYNARFEESAGLALSLRAPESHDIANDELRTSALLFQLRRLLDSADNRDDDKSAAWKTCAKCPTLLGAFTADIQHGQAAAREILKTSPHDENALFYLGKLDLNYVWLQLGLLGKRTGWDEYREARQSIDAVLKANPKHVRARVADAWMNYIVATRTPWGTRWLFGGGNRKKALASLREAAAAETDWVSHAEAEFALWDMLQREKNTAEAMTVAQRIAKSFPQNSDVAAYVAGGGVK